MSDIKRPSYALKMETVSEFRKPVSMVVDNTSIGVVCDDGAMFTLSQLLSPEWIEVNPIPGTKREKELRDESAKQKKL